MRPDDDRPLPLSHLQTPVPFTDFDYAAVRARVRSELAREQERRSWWVVVWRLAAVAMLVVLFIPRTRENAPPAVAAAPIARAVPAPVPTVPQVQTQVAAAAARPRPKRVRRHQHQPETAVSRIEIHTADPDVRIIWIAPKENS